MARTVSPNWRCALPTNKDTEGKAALESATLLTAEHRITHVDAPSAAAERCIKAVSATVSKEADAPASFAVPRRGHVLSTIAEEYGAPVRSAVSVLEGSLKRRPAADLSPLMPASSQHEQAGVHRTVQERLAWSMVSAWLVAVATESLPATASLEAAAEWFHGSCDGTAVALVSSRAAKEAEAALRLIADARALFDLLPYVLDPHGPGSRLSERRDPDTGVARRRKRQNGVFYTPADVAEYMAEATIGASAAGDPPTVFDPACGTGVFLRAALKALVRRFPRHSPHDLATHLFGTDIDPWPLDAAAFVLIADVWKAGAPRGLCPASLWKELRRNLAAIDTLRIDPAHADAARQHRVAIDVLFPALAGGPSIVIGNPPYADLGNRTDLPALSASFRTIAAKADAKAEIYLAFVEQMTRLTAGSLAGGALVLPLSIACNVGSQFTAIRKLIADTPGRWRFAFFDREPHALFGEDVKTRNAIVLWSRSGGSMDTRIETGPLRKWRGHNRAAMFRSLTFTPIGNGIQAGIPKIEGENQAQALDMLSQRWSRFEQAVVRIDRRDLTAAPFADNRTVFVGPTAYNFINVFLRPPRKLFRHELSLSEHPLYAVQCSTENEAFAAFAVLSSHLAYWWWRSHGDGFHVSRRFLEELPFGVETVTDETGIRLTDAGRALWGAMRERPIMSLNRGRTSLAYTPNGHDDLRRQADEVLAEIAGLRPAFVDELQRFTARSVSATLHGNATTLATDQEGI